ncbi:MAG: hypothetical protein HQL16_04805 [Candidatus Omnitrophica bacterium]|nr:hypothetical protein [Candidatus Omnitrophota bacterium]
MRNRAFCITFAVIVFAGCIFLFPNLSFAQRVLEGGSTLNIFGTVGRATEIFFEDGISNLVRSGDPATLKVEHISGHLFVTPLSTTPADLTIIDTRGRSSRLSMVFDKSFDDKIVVSAAADSGDEKQGESGVSSIIKDLVLGRTPKGATEKHSNSVVFDNGQFRLHLSTIYEMPHFLGYVIIAENLLNRSVLVPVEEITFPGLVAVSSEKDLLGAQGSSENVSLSKIFMVIKR